MFRRRNRDGESGSGQEPGDGNYPAADDELAEQDYADDDWDDEPGDDDLAGDEWDDEDDGDAADELSPAAAGDPGAADGADAGAGPGRADLGDPGTWTRLRDPSAASPAMLRSDGPWDGAGEFPAGERIDFGSLLVPVRDGFDVQVFVAEDEGISIAVVHEDSASSCSRSLPRAVRGLWDEVRHEIADEVAKAGGSSSEQDGPFGPELRGHGRSAGRGGAGHPAAAAPLPRRRRPSLVPARPDQRPGGGGREPGGAVRGDLRRRCRRSRRPCGAAAQPLEIRLPDEARQVLEDQLAAQEEPDLLNPFERGPEITETR